MPSILSVKDVIAMRAACRGGETPKAIAERVGLGENYVRAILTGRRWPLVPGALPCLRGRRRDASQGPCCGYHAGKSQAWPDSQGRSYDEARRDKIRANPGPCSNCREIKPLYSTRTGQCGACRMYRYRHGVDRPLPTPSTPPSL